MISSGINRIKTTPHPCNYYGDNLDRMTYFIKIYFIYDRKFEISQINKVYIEQESISLTYLMGLIAKNDF